MRSGEQSIFSTKWLIIDNYNDVRMLIIFMQHLKRFGGCVISLKAFLKCI